MVKRAIGLMVCLAVLLMSGQASLSAHPGHSHKVLGTVTSAAPDRLSLKDRDGKPVTIQVTKDTRVKATAPLKVEEIKPGTRVVVTATMDKDSAMTATLIEVGAADAAPAPK